MVCGDFDMFCCGVKVAQAQGADVNTHIWLEMHAGSGRKQ